MPSKMSFYLMVRFWRNWPDHGKCGPGRTRQWAARRKLSESVKDMHIPIPAKKKVKIFKSFLKYSKSSMSAYANFTVNWELTVRIYSSPCYHLPVPKSNVFSDLAKNVYFRLVKFPFSPKNSWNFSNRFNVRYKSSLKSLIPILRLPSPSDSET